MDHNRTISITGTGKTAIADVSIKDDEVNVIALQIFHENGNVTSYGRKQCSADQWLLYLMVKGRMYE